MPGSLQQDKDEIGGEEVATGFQYTFKLKAMQPTKTSKGGNVRVVDSRNFPVSKHIAAALIAVKPAACGKCTGIPTLPKWQHYIAGNGRMAVFFPVDNPRTMDFTPIRRFFVESPYVIGLPMGTESLRRQLRGPHP